MLPLQILFCSKNRKILFCLLTKRKQVPKEALTFLPIILSKCLKCLKNLWALKFKLNIKITSISNWGGASLELCVRLFGENAFWNTGGSKLILVSPFPSSCGPHSQTAGNIVYCRDSLAAESVWFWLGSLLREEKEETGSLLHHKDSKKTLMKYKASHSQLWICSVHSCMFWHICTFWEKQEASPAPFSREAHCASSYSGA